MTEALLKEEMNKSIKEIKEKTNKQLEETNKTIKENQEKQAGEENE